MEETVLKVRRAGEENPANRDLKIPLGMEFEELRQAAFSLAYPGNGEAPWECKLETTEGFDITDMGLIGVIPDNTVVVNPGADFVDQNPKSDKPRERRSGTFSKLVGSFRGKKGDKADKGEKTESEDEGEKSDKDKDKDKDKENKSQKRLSFFGSVRKTKAADYNEKDSELPDWLRLQKRIFTRYVNQRFRSANSKVRVEDLSQDCKDGLVLIDLLEIMSGKPFPDKKPKPQKVRIKQIDNCNMLLSYAKDCGIITVCSAENIVDGDEKNLMSFIYQIIIKYMKLDDDDDSAGMDVKETLILWFKNKFQGYDITIDEKNICKTFYDGMAFCALLHKMRPRLIPYNDLIKEQKIKNLTLSLETAEQYAGVQQYVEPTDIAKLDELGMIVYLSDWYHGISFMELQNNGARRIGKLVQMTILHDKMKAEYDDRAKTLANWIEAKIKDLDDHTFDNTLEGIKAKQTQFYAYKAKEKVEKISEQMEIEALFDDLALRLQTHQRPPYNTPTGLSVQELRNCVKNLEAAENRRSEAMQKELARQIKLSKLVARFKADTAKITEWVQKKQGYLQAKDDVTSIASAQKFINVLAAFHREWENVKQTKLASLKSLGQEISGDNYKDKSAILSQVTDVENNMQQLLPLVEAKGNTLNADLELEKKKEQLRLDFASAAKDFDLFGSDQVEIASAHYFGDLLEQVEAFNITLTQAEQAVQQGLADRKQNYQGIWTQLQGLKVTENIYTPLTPEALDEIENKVHEALKTRRAAYLTELERQKANEALCKECAAKNQAFFTWLGVKKEAVNGTHLELEAKLEQVKKELANTRGEAEAKIKELEELDAKIFAAEIFSNRYAKSSTRETKIALEQYYVFLEKIHAGLEVEYENKKNKGITEEQRQEIAYNFRYFDRDQSGFLEFKEFRACLQSLGQDSKPADVKEALSKYDLDMDGKISLKEFSDFMTSRIGDSDSKEEILASFQVINQAEQADVDHLNAVVHDIAFPQDHVEYLLKNMPPKEEATYDYHAWTEEVFAR